MNYNHNLPDLTKSGTRPLGRLARVAIVSVAALAVTLGMEAASAQIPYLDAKAGDLVDVKLGELYPTQAVLGLFEVYYKLGRYQAGKDKINKRFDDWCEANGQEKAETADANSRLDDPASFTCAVALGSETAATIDPMKTVVIGPRGKLYLVDGHHTFTSFMESPDGGANMHVRARVLANLSKLNERSFWKTMKASGWVWLRDEDNRPIPVGKLPKRLGLANFKNDDYRAVVYFTRDVAYAQRPNNANYQEFYWGAWLRTNPDFDLKAFNLTDFDGYVGAVKKAAELMSDLAGTDPVSTGYTAAALGRIDFNTSEFTKVSGSYCTSKPGKVAYASYYYHNILGNSPQIVCP
ncbi:MAG: ParB/Srx family N-terminal domain-containing protein [Pseudomonadota bacterium]